MPSEEPEPLVVACCRELIHAPSPSGQEGPAARVARAWMERLGYDELSVDEHGSVVGRIVGRAGAGPHVLLDGHLDTVPVTSPEQWSHDPLAADLVDGRIFGRGAADMKGPLAAMLCAAARVPRSELCGTITVSASVQEELLEGAALTAILGQRPADMVIIGEATRLRVGVAQKGRAGIQVTAYGRPAHSSAPEQGDNAVYRMVEAVRRLRRLELPRDDQLGPAVLELTEIVSSPYPGSSIVPDRCRARYDRRLVRGERRDEVLAEMRRALADLDAVEVDYDEAAVPCYTGTTLRRAVNFHPAWAIPEEHRLVRSALAALEAAGLDARCCALPFCTNGSASAGDLQIPTIIFGPGDPTQFHVVDEHVTVDQLTRAVGVYTDLLHRLGAG